MGVEDGDYLYCTSPDRDVPGIKCGYPLPCPHHSVLVVIGTKRKKTKKTKKAR